MAETKIEFFGGNDDRPDDNDMYIIIIIIVYDIETHAARSESKPNTERYDVCTPTSARVTYIVIVLPTKFTGVQIQSS